MKELNHIELKHSFHSPQQQQSEHSSSLEQRPSYYLVEDEITKWIIIELYFRKYIKQSDLIKVVKKRLGLKYSNNAILRRIKNLIDIGIILVKINLVDTKSPILILNKDKVRIERNIKYYMDTYYIVGSISILSFIISYLFNNYGILIGSSIMGIAIISKCIYDIFKHRDLLVVKILR